MLVLNAVELHKCFVWWCIYVQVFSNKISFLFCSVLNTNVTLSVAVTVYFYATEIKLPAVSVNTIQRDYAFLDSTAEYLITVSRILSSWKYGEKHRIWEERWLFCECEKSRFAWNTPPLMRKQHTTYLVYMDVAVKLPPLALPSCFKRISRCWWDTRSICVVVLLLMSILVYLFKCKENKLYVPGRSQ